MKRDEVAALVARWNRARARWQASGFGPANPGSAAAEFLRARSIDDCAALRALSIDLVEPLRAAKLDAILAREVARAAVPGAAARALPTVERLAATLDELLASLAPKRRTGRRTESRDARAVAAVDLFEDREGSDYRPRWTVGDVAELLGCDRSALNGKQRDGSLRCPRFMDRWRAHRYRPTADRPGLRGRKLD